MDGPLVGRLVWQWADGGVAHGKSGHVPKVGTHLGTQVLCSLFTRGLEQAARLNFSGVSAKVRPQAYEMAIHAVDGPLLNK